MISENDLGKSVSFKGDSCLFKHDVVTFILEYFKNKNFDIGISAFSKYIAVSDYIKPCNRSIVIRNNTMHSDITIDLNDNKTFLYYYNKIHNTSLSKVTINEIDTTYKRLMLGNNNTLNYSDVVNRVISFIYSPDVEKLNYIQNNIKITMLESIFSNLLDDNFNFNVWDSSKKVISTKEYNENIIKITSWISGSKCMEEFVLRVLINIGG